MFSVPFELWVGIVLSILVCGGIVAWVIFEWKHAIVDEEKGKKVQKVDVVTCKYCGAVIELKEDETSIIVCPVCGSYL